MCKPAQAPIIALSKPLREDVMNRSLGLCTDACAEPKRPVYERYEAFEEQLPNHVLAQRVATAAGVSTQSVIRAAQRRYRTGGKRDRKRLDGCPYTFVSLSLWDDYMQVGPVLRVPERPAGWFTVKAVVARGIGKRRVYELIHNGGLEAVYVGNTMFVAPDSLAHYLEVQRRHKPCAGWRLVSEVYEQAGTSKQALSNYLKRHEVETRHFKHPVRDQQVAYMPADVAECYLALKRGR